MKERPILSMVEFPSSTTYVGCKNIDEFHEKVLETTKAIWGDCGKIVPQFILVSKQSLFLSAGVVFESEEDKNQVSQAIRELIRERNVYAIAFVCEGWMVDASKSKKPLDVRPSKHPQRIEILWASSEWKSPHSRKDTTYRIIRDEKGKVVELSPKGMPQGLSVAGRFANFFG